MSDSHLSHTTYNLPLKIDAHQHFWKYDPVRDSWFTDEMPVIRRDFFPEHLHPILQENNFDGCVAVQADQSEADTDFLLDLAGKNNFIKGVVGWVDLQSKKLEERLEHYKQFNKLKGFRHVLQGEKDRSFMLQPEFTRGIKALQQFNFTYDILIFPDQLQYTKKFAAMFPQQKFVIDHLAKPTVKEKKIDEWKKDIEAIAEYQNVCCKISGLVTEADWKNWNKDDLTPYIDVVVNAFGTDRIMFGSDWPVCLLAASYGKMLDIVKDYFSSFSKEDREKFFGGNAINFYNLN